MKNYRVYSRKPNWFIRICLILLILIPLFSLIFAPLCTIPILLFVRDVKKCKSYIEFTDFGIIIDDYQWWFIHEKHIYQKIPYSEISSCKCFYDTIRRRARDDSCFKFIIYIKNSKKTSTFTVEQQNLYNLDTSKIKWFFQKNKIKVGITYHHSFI